MKKITKIVAGVACLATLACGAAAMTGCAKTETYNGEYSYENTWTPGNYYGCKVTVSVKGDKISAVTYEEDTETYVNFSGSWKENQNPGDLGHDKAVAAYADYVAETFIGKSVLEVLSVKVDTNNAGQPGAINDKDYVLTGATQTSGRTILAIQNALKNQGYQIVTGEYSYENSWTPGNYYGCKVQVVLKDGKIVAVSTTNDTETYVNFTGSWKENQNPGDLGHDKAVAGFQAWANDAFVGKTIAEVNAYSVETNEKGQPSKVTGAIYTGASQTAGRTILAVQNALKNVK